ncbi:hypothetical protein R5R35_004609 [Gryllus longicercus]|uniref:Speckle targeted PIP5K1A-regulated poly(A) polymerase n=1 Tax=Gryllus longicercus TaxID=2509291 RepID=A0AAN9ZA23_9ORTH
MEVRGSVIVGDDGEENSKPPIKGGFADLGRPIEPHEKDDVPRILVKNFRRNTKPSKLHTVFSNFGAITYMAVKDQKAVIEFSDRTAVQEILKCKFLKVQGSRVDCEPLQRFLHVERCQFQVELHADLMQLQSEETFSKFTARLCQQAAANTREDVQSLCQQLESVARAAYPYCKAHPFGSRVTRLGLEGCDLDIFLDCGNMYNGENDQQPVQQQNLGETTLKQMVKCDDFGRIHKVLHARVPILKFFHLPTGIYGDIAFRNGLGVENSKLLNFLQSLDNRLQSLFLFVKMWARLQCLRSVSEPHHFTSYALVMMAVFYLQQLPQPVLPPIKKLMEEHKGEQQVIAGWPCSFTQDKKVVPKTRNSSSLLELTRGFFHFYQFFHFEWKIICPYLGKAIERKDMDDILNPEGELGYLLPTYVNNLQQDDGEPLHTRSAVCIQDPFEHSHNLSRSVKDEILMNFISSCGLMYEKFCTFS